MKLIIWLLLIISTAECFSQSINDSVIKSYSKVHKGLEEARNANPDSVLIIDLRSNGLKKFPKELLKYKNLEVILYGSYHYGNTPYFLTRSEMRKVKRKKRRYGAFYSPDVYHPNKIDLFPDSFYVLKKLKYFDLDGTTIPLERVVELKKMFPNIVMYPEWIIFKYDIDFYNEHYAKDKNKIIYPSNW